MTPQPSEAPAVPLIEVRQTLVPMVASYVAALTSGDVPVEE